jgi:hypothetical protein
MLSMIFISTVGIRGLGILLAAFTLAACGGQSFIPLDSTRDLGARPGLLSGDRGYLEYTIQKPLKETEKEETVELFMPFEDY